MKNIATVFACCLLLGGIALAQMEKPAENRTVSQVLNNSVKNIESELVPTAEAMPEDKFSFAPTSGEFKGVRTFAQQIKHVASVNYILGGAILGEKPPADTGGEDGPDSVKSKADIVKYLKDSFAYVHKATESVNDKELVAPIKNPFGEGTATRMALTTVGVVGHCSNHYGQMVEYLRMNGIVPPASRSIVACLPDGAARPGAPIDHRPAIRSGTRVPFTASSPIRRIHSSPTICHRMR